MSTDGHHADENMLTVVAKVRNVEIEVFQVEKDKEEKWHVTSYLINENAKQSRVQLSYYKWAYNNGCHYNLLVPEEVTYIFCDPYMYVNALTF
jgi:hypothetical protein